MNTKPVSTPNRLSTLAGPAQRVQLAGSPPIDADIQRWERELFFQPRPLQRDATPQRNRRVALLLALCIGLCGATGTALADGGSGSASGDAVSSDEGSLWDWFLMSLGFGDSETSGLSAKSNENADPGSDEP